MDQVALDQTLSLNAILQIFKISKNLYSLNPPGQRVPTG
jgi:hypothetical protein